MQNIIIAIWILSLTYLSRASSHFPFLIPQRNTTPVAVFGTSTTTVVTALEFKFSHSYKWLCSSQDTLDDNGKLSRLINSNPFPVSKSGITMQQMLR